jgi:hypothetical protein
MGPGPHTRGRAWGAVSALLGLLRAACDSGRWYWLWLGAALLMAVGGAADIAWHFAHLFDEFSIPHLMLGAGQGMQIALLLWALVWQRRHLGAAERAALQFVAVTEAIGVAFVPLDLLNHLIFGVDITTWSPTHLGLNYIATMETIGVLAAWLSTPMSRRPRAWVVTFLFGVVTLQSVHFPLYQQEYAAVALDAFGRHRLPWYVAPDMWALAGPRLTQLLDGHAPGWLYLIYLALVASFVLALGSRVLGGRSAVAMRARTPILMLPRTWPWRSGTATALALAFVLYRILSAQIYAILGMPIAVVPWYLVAMGLTLDAVFALAPVALARLSTRWSSLRTHAQLIVPAVGGGLAGLVLSACLLLGQAMHAVVPAAPAGALPIAILTGAAGAVAGSWLAQRMFERASHSQANEPVASARQPVLASIGAYLRKTG